MRGTISRLGEKIQDRWAWRRVYPYKHMDSMAKFQETQLPAREAFFNQLNDEELSEMDLEHAQGSGKPWPSRISGITTTFT